MHEKRLQGVKSFAHVDRYRYCPYKLLPNAACMSLLEGEALLRHDLTSMV